jgi:hypothetical protein
MPGPGKLAKSPSKVESGGMHHHFSDEDEEEENNEAMADIEALEI